MAENDKGKYRQQGYINTAYTKILDSAMSKCNSEIEAILRYMGYGYRIKADILSDQLEEIKTELGISVRTVELSGEWYKDSMLPMLVKYKGEYKAVLPNFKGTCIYWGEKKRKKINEDNAFLFDNMGVCFYKGFTGDKITKGKLLKFMLSCVRPREYMLLLIASLMSAAFSVLYTQVQYHIFQKLIPSGSERYILSVGAFLMGLIINMFIVNVFKGIISGNMSLLISANLQGAVMTRLLNIKPAFFAERKSGSLSQNIIKLSDTADIISGESTAAIMSFLLSFVYIGAAAVYVNEFIPFINIFLVIILILNIANAFAFNRYNREFYKHTSEMTGFVYELFGGMENVKLNNADETMFDRWSEYYIETLRAYKKPLFLKYYNAFYMLISALYMILLYYVGIKTDISAASFITFMALYGMFVSAISGAERLFDCAVRYNTAFERIKDFLNAEIEETEIKANLRGMEKGIEFSNVSYKYPNTEKDVFSNVSFSLPKGKKIGIVGKSGCGKSTLLKLLLGFEKPHSGHIFIDDTDINEINLRSYRKNFGIVLQTTKLIPADIYSNITLTSPLATKDEVMAVLETVGLKTDIEKMPMGLSTFVSEDNMSISAGQKQRILLARAIITKPVLLVLDEATNALDNITQAAVTRYIESTDTTAVIVAHRLSTIKQCDNIILLDDGEIAECGNYDELIAKNGKFYELVKNQL